MEESLGGSRSGPPDDDTETTHGTAAEPTHGTHGAQGTDALAVAERADKGHEHVKASAQNAPPFDLCCPITLDLFEDPVQTLHGMTYERRAIEDWLHRHTTDPMTGERLLATTVWEDEDMRRRRGRAPTLRRSAAVWRRCSRRRAQAFAARSRRSRRPAV